MFVSISSGKTFFASGEETLLDAAQRTGITLPYSCKTGRCSTCKARIASGNTVARHEELGLTEAERKAGWILSCVRSAATDLQLEIEDLSDFAFYPTRTSACRIHSIDRVASNVIKVVLRFPAAAEQRFHPGQYVDVIGHGGLRRSYSIANAPSAQSRIELHIRKVAGGAMSRYWFDEAKINDLLRVNGPLGTFFLRNLADRNLVFLATGTGIAPVKAMLEGLSSRMDADAEQPRSVWVFWGNRDAEDLYWSPSDVPFPHRFVPVLSRAGADWKGARGHVQQAAMAQMQDWENATVYACGSDTMIHAAHQALVAKGLPARQFYSDAFVCSAPD